MRIAQPDRLKDILNKFKMDEIAKVKNDLSSVHISLNQGKRLRDALTAIRDTKGNPLPLVYQFDLNRIVMFIGEFAFKDAHFGQVRNTIDQISSGREPTGDLSGGSVLPGFDDQEQADQSGLPGFSDFDEEDEPTEEVEKGDTTGLLPGFSDEAAPKESGPGSDEAATEESIDQEVKKTQSEQLAENIQRMKKYISVRKSFPPHTKTMSDIFFSNLKQNTGTSQSSLQRGGDISEELQNQKEWLEGLERMLHETEPPAVEPEATKDFELPEERDKRLKRRTPRGVKVVKTDSPLDEDEKANLKEAGKDESEVDDATALANVSFLSNAPVLITIGDDGMPVLDYQTIDKLYSQLKESLMSISNEAEAIYSRDNARASTIRKKFNSIFHAVKVKDWETKLVLMNNSEQIRVALGGASAFNKLQRDIARSYLSSKLRADSALFTKLYYPLAFCISYSLIGHILKTKDLTFKSDSIKQEDIAYDELLDKYLIRANNQVSSKFMKIFDVIHSPNFYTTRFDTIKALKVNTGDLVMRTFRSMYGKQAGNSRIYFKRSFCPVCYKQINWSKPKVEKTHEKYERFVIFCLTILCLGLSRKKTWQQ